MGLIAAKDAHDLAGMGIWWYWRGVVGLIAAKDARDLAGMGIL